MRKKKLVVAGVATAVIAGTATAAFAYWSTSGTGTGSATTGTSSALVVTVDKLTTADLSPNGPTDTVHFTVKNTNTGAQNYSVATPTVTGTSNTGCTAADFQISNLSGGYADLASGDTASGSFQLQMIDTGKNQDPCKGATVNLQVLVG